MTMAELDPWGMQIDAAPAAPVDKRTEQIRTASMILWEGGGDDTELCDRLARQILDTIYPLLKTADELDALKMNAVVVDQRGVAWERVVSPGNRLLDHADRCWAKQGAEVTRNSRHTSAEILRGDRQYLLVYGGV